MNFILNLLYFYVAIYSVFFLFLSIKNLSGKKLGLQNKYSNVIAPKNLSLIVYAHNDGANLHTLLNQLKEQRYPDEKYSVFVILDNCNDNSEQIVANDNFAQVLNIKGQGTIGKDQAISILLEKLSEGHYCDAYVFLDANRFVDNDFLANINDSLDYSPVLSGSTVLIGEDLNLRQKVKKTFHKYYTNFLQKSRSLAGLATTIDSSIFVIRKALMEKIGCIDFQNINTELKYSLLLSKIGCKCVFNPKIKTYINIDEFTLRIPSLTTRLELFRNGFTQIWTKNVAFTEHVCSLLTPNILLLLAAYAYLLSYSFGFYFIVDFSVVVISFALLILGFAISLIPLNLKSREVVYLCLYPIYSFGHVLKNLPPCRVIRNLITGKRILKANTEMMILDVSVTDGKNIIPCKLELISENGLAKVRFIFKQKKFTTKSNLRMVDAISELVKKLSEYGFTLRICQCCSRFTPNIDGSTNMIKGFCNGSVPTLLWNSCPEFCNNRVNGIIEEIFQ
jgi:cellulose synthase/poly-beta-1,6-N-acetylglucosamine synthase-like glycosyltransferase